MKVVISGSDIAAILTAVGTIMATVFAFINVMMTNRQNKIMAERDAKRDQQNHDDTMRELAHIEALLLRRVHE